MPVTGEARCHKRNLSAGQLKDAPLESKDAPLGEDGRTIGRKCRAAAGPLGHDDAPAAYAVMSDPAAATGIA